MKVQRFKTTPREHQHEALKRADGEEAFAFLMEQGTGKTKVGIDEAAWEWRKGNIDGLLVIAPNGVHINWILDEIPAHAPDWLEGARYAYWAASLTKKEKRALNEVLAMGKGEPFRILAVNVEALMLDRVREMIRDYLDGARIAIIVDESQRIKNPKIVRSKFLHKMRPRSVYRRIMTGTIITQSPFDAWSQFQFLDPSIIDEPSYTAFKAQYAELLGDEVVTTLDDDGNRVQKVVRNPLLERINQNIRANRSAGQSRFFAPQVIKRDENGEPMYKNLDKLRAILAPHSYRVLKADCLDLPDKVYQRRYVEMTAAQQKLYDKIRQELLIEWEQNVTPVTKLTSLGKLQQVICGYIVAQRGMEPSLLFKKPLDNPRIQALLSVIEDHPDSSIIIWARYTTDIETIAKVLRAQYGEESVVEYYGATKRKARVEARNKLKDRSARFFVGNPESGGTGITLITANVSIYYSNSFKLEPRLQSEDRVHRIGQSRTCVYIDLETRNTIDRRIINAMRAKKEIADIISGDEANGWLTNEGQ